MERAQWSLNYVIQKRIFTLQQLIKTYFETHLDTLFSDPKIKMEYDRLKEIFVLLYNEKYSIMKSQNKWQECIQLFIKFNNVSDDINDIENMDILNDLYERQHYLKDAIKIEICNNCTYLDFYKKL